MSGIVLHAKLAFLLLHSVSANLFAGLSRLHPSLEDEVNLKVPEIIEKYNYTTEVHRVITEDGYILELHRIVAAPGSDKPNERRPPVLLMHGILGSSADWIITGPGHGLAYLLAEQGFDVWMGNTRGNRYSKNHTHFDTNSDEFWNFSWHEIGVFDLPAIIDHILYATKSPKIIHIGHSQGSTTFYVMCSDRPSYNAKVIAHISLAPVAFVDHMTSPFMQILSKGNFLLENFAKLFGINEFMPQNGLISRFNQKLCKINVVTEFICTNTLFAICGFNYKQLNRTFLPLILAHVPAGSSTKQLLHFAQEISSGKFRQYDYGVYGNQQHYQEFSPPEYDLGLCTTPVYLVYSKNDWMSSPVDVQRLGTALGNLRGKFLVDNGKFNHLDYLYGIDAPRLLYKKIINLLNKIIDLIE